ncbi:MAG TPA: GspH/FimT family protein [Candidatus Binatia bacterium]|nr:GspH/FimT family protein [Candidatus Binatia bacterium]
MGQQSEVDARGFTLLELIVTLLVVTVAVGLVAPAIGRNTEALRARAEVAGFSATFRHAREQAITTRQQYTVVVNPVSRLMTVTAGEDEVRWTRALSGRVAVEAAPPGTLTVRFEPQGTSSGGEFRLTSGKVSYRVSVDAVTGRVRNHRE